VENVKRTKKSRSF